MQLMVQHAGENYLKIKSQIQTNEMDKSGMITTNNVFVKTKMTYNTILYNMEFNINKTV